MKGIATILHRLTKPLKNVFISARKRSARFIDKHPFGSFFVVLGTLIVLIVLSNVIGAPKQPVKKETELIKDVQVYRIGNVPRLTVSAQIRKSGVIRITALTGGVVQRIYKEEGSTFYRGQTLIALSSNYQGGNIQALNRKLSLLQRDFNVNTLQSQKDLIGKQKELSEEVNDASGETDVSKLTEDVTKKQLDLQSQSLDLAREVSEVQLQIAQVTEAAMYPSAPFVGVVDRVYVKVGQAVNPGQVLMQISEDIKVDPVTAIAYVSADIAKKVSRIEPSVITINESTSIKLFPFYVSQNAIEGLLYAVYYDIPEEYRALVTEDGFVSVEMPVGQSDTSSYAPFVPVDAVYQTKDASYLYLAVKGRAVSRQVKLGEVYGGYVQVADGLKDADEVIINRNVIASDRIKVAN